MNINKAGRKLLSVLAVPFLLLSAVVPVMANGESVSETYDGTKKGSITLYKYVSNDYVQIDNKGLALDQINYDQMQAVQNAANNRTMLPEEGVNFKYVRIGSLKDMSSTSQTTAYYTDLDQDFVNLVRNDYKISIPAETKTDDDGTKAYYQTDNVLNAMKKLVKAPAAGSRTKTGADAVRDLVNQKGTAFAPTDEFGGTSVENLPTGLYLVAETDWEHQMVSKRDGKYTRIEPGTEDAGDGASYADIVHPSQPFLIQLPMTSMDTITSDGQTYPAGSVWQYDVTAYPKNQTSFIHKDIVTDTSAQGTVTDGRDTNDVETPCDYGITNLKYGDNTAADGENKTGLTHQRDASIGDTVQQVITSSVPAARAANGSKLDKYIISDRMTKGLKFMKLDSVTIGADAWDGNNTVLDSSYYSQNTADDKYSFALIFNSKFFDMLESNTAQKFVYVKFTAMVTSDAMIGTDTYSYSKDDGSTVNAGNQNTAKLTYSTESTDDHDYYSNTPKLYTYEIDLDKTVSAAGAKADQYSQIHFKIEENANGKKTALKWMPYTDSAGQLYYELFKQEDAGAYTGDAGKAVDTVTPDQKDGIIRLRGLDDSDYIFTETATAKGLNLMTDTFTVRLVAHHTADELPVKYEDGTLDHAYVWSGEEPADLSDYDVKSTPSGASLSTGRAVLRADNHPVINLLRTGGRGRLLFYAGGVLIIVVGILLVSKKHRKNDENEPSEKKEDTDAETDGDKEE